MIRMLKYSPLFSYGHDNHLENGEILPIPSYYLELDALLILYVMGG
jgi:hypothetical protein